MVLIWRKCNTYLLESVRCTAYPNSLIDSAACRTYLKTSSMVGQSTSPRPPPPPFPFFPFLFFAPSSPPSAPSSFFRFYDPTPNSLHLHPTHRTGRSGTPDRQEYPSSREGFPGKRVEHLMCIEASGVWSTSSGCCSQSRYLRCRCRRRRSRNRRRRREPLRLGIGRRDRRLERR